MSRTYDREGQTTVVITAVWLFDTPKAVAITTDSKDQTVKPIFLPKSQFAREKEAVLDSEELTYKFFIPLWLANAKELDYKEWVEHDEKDMEEVREYEAECVRDDDLKELDPEEDIRF